MRKPVPYLLACLVALTVAAVVPLVLLKSDKGKKDQLEQRGVLVNQAIAARYSKDFDKATELLEQVFELEQEIYGQAHEDLIGTLDDLCEIAEAERDFQKIAIYRQRQRVIVEQLYGKDDYRTRDAVRAVADAHQYNKLTENQRQELDRVKSLKFQSVEALQSGRYEPGIELANEVLRIQKQLLGDQHTEYLSSLKMSAALYSAAGDSTEAESLYLRLLEIQQNVLGEHPEYAETLSQRATQLLNMGDYADAKPMFIEAMQIQKQVLGENHADYAKTMHDLAGIYLSEQDFAQAATLLIKALQIREKVFGKTHPDYANTLNSLAGLYLDNGDLDSARPLLEQACESIRESLGEQNSEFIESLRRLARFHGSAGNHKESIRLHQQAVGIVRSVYGEDHPYLADCLSSLAEAHRYTNQYDRRHQLDDQAQAILASVNWKNFPSYLGIKLHLEVYQHLRNGNFEQGIKTLKSQNELYPGSLDSLERGGTLAFFFALAGKREQAEEYYRRPVELLRDTLDQQGTYQSQRQLFASQRIARYNFDNRLDNLLVMNAPAASVLEDYWRWKGAVTERLHAYRQMAANDELRPLFLRLQSIGHRLSVIAQNDSSSANPVTAEAGTKDYLDPLRSSKKLMEALTEQKEKLERKIASLNSEFLQARTSITIEDLQSRLEPSEAFVDFLEYRHMEWNQKNADTDLERRFMAFVVRKDRPAVMFDLLPAKKLSELINRFRVPFQPDSDKEDKLHDAAIAGQQIRSELWEPIEKHLDGIEAVIVSPDTVLGTLPFSALPGRKEDSFLIEDYSIANAPSVSFALQRDRAKPADKKQMQHAGLLLVGNVDYAATPAAHESDDDVSRLLVDAGKLRSRARTWESLSGFQGELNAVKSLYHDQFGEQASAIVLAGRNADEINFLRNASQFATLHIITHGYFEDPNVGSFSDEQQQFDDRLFQIRGTTPYTQTFVPGLLSGLVMAGANRSHEDPNVISDGILRASEIEMSPLQNVDLVVLSACETGLGRVAGGEGMTGLQRAFHLAGARSVVASLWKVNDAATQTLMTEFYTNLWQKKMTKIESLRQAQLAMIRDYDPSSGNIRALGKTSTKVDTSKPMLNEGVTSRLDPKYWAAFQLSGDWR